MKKFFSGIAGFVCRFQYELSIYLFLLLTELPNADFSSVYGWQTVSYVISYKYGFNSRFLIGSLLRLIFPESVPAYAAGLLVNITTAFNCLLIALALGALLRAAKKRGQFLLIGIPIAFYLVLPAGINTYFIPGFSGKLEIFLILPLFISACMLITGKPSIPQFIALGVISVIAMLTYQNYMFLCFPLIFALMLLNLYNYGWSVKNTVGYASVCVISGILFLYLQLFAGINAENAELLTEILSRETDLKIVESAVFYEYFASFSQFFADLQICRFEELLTTAPFDILLLSPFVAVYLYIWITALRSCTEKRDKQMLIFMQLSSLIFMPAYIITCDWTRWTIFVFLFHIAIILALWYRNFAPMVTALEKLSRLARKYTAIFIIALVYLFSLSVCDFIHILWVSVIMSRNLLGLLGF